MFLKLLLALAATFFFLSTLIAAPGDIDVSFGSGGRGLLPVGKISLDQGRASALQPDGKIIVIGDTILAGDWLTEPANLIVVRLNPDGSRDSSFGIGGIVVKRLSMSVTGAAVVVQEDGKIVVGGFANVEVSVTVVKRAFLLVRLLPDGSPDNSFGNAGVVISNLDIGQHTTLTSLALQPDGKVVAVGFSSLSSPTSAHEIVVARYNSEGSLDNSFDGDGKIFILAGGALSRASAVAIQPDGKIVVGGSVSPSDFLVLRLNPNGSLDGSFDGDGSVVTNIAGTTSFVSALALLQDGRIIAAGVSGAGSSRNIAIARYNDNGSLDNTFDTDGIVVTDVGDDVAASVRIQLDGKILIGGHTIVTPGQPFEFLALRYNSNGSLDSTFDTDGKVTTRVGVLGSDRASSLLLQPDGRIMLAGSLADSISSDFALVRYNADGSLDPGFDGDGKALLELGNAGDSVYATAIQPDGKIVCVGYVFGGWTPRPGVARFNADGTPDTAFGDEGSVIYLAPSADYGFVANDVAIQHDGKILFSIQSDGVYPYTVVRLNPDGSYDNAFGTGGTLSVPVGTARDEAAGLELQPDGKIVLAGVSHNADLTFGPSIVRLNANGTPDETFGVGGKVLNTDSAVSGSVYALALQPDGKIILAGGGVVATDYTFFTSRYNANGSVDVSFGGTGAVNTSIGSSSEGARTLSVQADGKIVVGGYSYPGAAVVRYNPNGTLDDTFDGDGKLIVPGQPALYSWFEDVAIQPDGKIVLVGSERTPVGTFGIERYNATVFRFNGDGSPDSSFGTNGRVVNTIGDHNSAHNSVSLLANGKIIAGGTSSNGLNDDFTVVRYVGDSLPGLRAPFDFDGDGKTDIGIFRPNGAASEWWVNRSSTGQTFALQFGASTDKITPADYTGDGKSDIAFFRPSSGEWYVLRSEDFSFFALPFGTNGDVPVPADYDADGKADFAVFRPSSSTWFISQLSGAPTRIVQFGVTGDQPVVADYDADGKADIGIFRPAAGGAEWWIQRSTAGLLALQFGASTDKAVQGDYTGDGKADVAVWKPSTGEWFIVRSEDTSFYGFPFGANTDTPAPGDYDGDGKFDATVFRPSSATWFIARSTAGTQIVQFGATGDQPIPNAFIP